MGAENIHPYINDERCKTEQVRDMFDSIAPAYDFMNRAMSFGIDKRWRAKAVDIIKAKAPTSILDLATGTADLAIELARQVEGCEVTGADLSEKMVEIGRRKVAEAGLENRVKLTVANGLELPMENDSFDCVTIAYGIRNFESLADGYREMARVLKPGGMLVVLELSVPTSPLPKLMYNLYTRALIPLAGRLVSKDVRAYSYLPESIREVAQGEAMTALIAGAGFGEVRYRPMTFGTCTLYTGIKS